MKTSRRPGREEQKERYRAQRRILRQRQHALGLEQPSRPTASNATCEMHTVEEEQTVRVMAVVEQVVVMRTLLPVLLHNLRGIEDPRQSAEVKHQLSALLLYGILLFVFQMASRREANRTMTRPQFLENLKLLFPEIEELPHHDTLARVLARIDVEQIQEALGSASWCWSTACTPTARSSPCVASTAGSTWPCSRTAASPVFGQKPSRWSSSTRRAKLMT